MTDNPSVADVTLEQRSYYSLYLTAAVTYSRGRWVDSY